MGAYAFNGCKALERLAAADNMTAVQYVRSRWSPPTAGGEREPNGEPNGFGFSGFSAAQQMHEQQLLHQQQSFSEAQYGHGRSGGGGGEGTGELEAEVRALAEEVRREEANMGYGSGGWRNM